VVVVLTATQLYATTQVLDMYHYAPQVELFYPRSMQYPVTKQDTAEVEQPLIAAAMALPVLHMEL